MDQLSQLDPQQIAVVLTAIAGLFTAVARVLRALKSTPDLVDPETPADGAPVAA